MNLATLTDHYLTRSAQFEEEQHESSGLWSASRLGSCLRAQYLHRLGVPETKGKTASDLRQMAAGKERHATLRQQMDDLGLLVSPNGPCGICEKEHEEFHLESKELYLTGYVDLLLDPHQVVSKNGNGDREAFLSFLRAGLPPQEAYPALVEVKATNPESMYFARNKGPSDHHMLQLASYRLMVEAGNPLPVKPQRYVLWLSPLGRDSRSKEVPQEQSYELDNSYVEEARYRLDRLNVHWGAEELPPCSCKRDFGGKGHQYCAYGDGGLTGNCCGEDLLKEVS